MITVTKCVKQYSIKLPPEQISELSLILHRYNKVRNYIFTRFGSINGLAIVRYPRCIRDEWVKTGFAKQWGLPPKYWKMALEDAVGTIKSGWEGTKTKIRPFVNSNSNLTQDEKAYCYYILKADSLLHAVLTNQSIERPAKIAKLKVNEKKVHILLKRLVRKYKFGRPDASKGKSLMIDENMYSYKSKSHNIGIQGLQRGKQIRLNTKDKRQFKGNLAIVIRDDHIGIHKAIQTRINKLAENENIIGVDKGYRTLIATSENRKYGEGFNELLTRESDRLSGKNRQRGKIWSLLKKHEKKCNSGKAKKIQKFNMGRKKYNGQKAKSKALKTTQKNFAQFHYNLDFCKWL